MTTHPIIEATARAIWETWRTSEAAPDPYPSFPWELLVKCCETHPDVSAPRVLSDLARLEAANALRVLAEATPTPGMIRAATDAMHTDDLEPTEQEAAAGFKAALLALLEEMVKTP